MIQRILILLLSIVLSGSVFSQDFNFFIVGRNGDTLNDTVFIIEGMTLNLSTNFEQLGIEYVSFKDNESYGNDGVGFPVGFNFKYYGENKDIFNISPTGFITFNEPLGFPIRYPNKEIPFRDAERFQNSIHGCFMVWEPVSDKSVSVYRTVEDTVSILCVTWCDSPINRPADPANPTGTFQIVLNNKDEISIHLVNIPKSEDHGGNATMGIVSDWIQFTAVIGMNNEPWTPIQEQSFIFTPEEDDVNYDYEMIEFAPHPVPEYIVWYEVDESGNETEIGSNYNISVKPKQTTKYRAELYSCWGDTIASAEITVDITGAFPNAFRPASTIEENKTFKIMLKETPVDVVGYLLQVYNRWGQLVFETDDYKEGWDGTFKGSACSAGVYNWTLMFEESGKSKIATSGSVMLLR
ncbi:MAG: gliding motility-associated C-terminal domain-containing protein [Bacteroidales bacterium]